MFFLFIPNRCRSKITGIQQLVIGPYQEADGSNFCRIPIKDKDLTVNIPIKAKMDGKYEHQDHEVDVTITMYKEISSSVIQHSQEKRTIYVSSY